MDEGFTSYAQAMTKEYLYGTKNPLARRLNSYQKLAISGYQEPMTTQSDHYATNTAYGTAAYSMGALVPYQLAYIMGKETFLKAFRDYYYTWRFHHPTPADFETAMEKHSGMVLDWFFLDWIGTTNHLDYAIESVTGKGDQTEVKLVNKDQRKMPVELLVTYKNGDQKRYYSALRMMRGEKVFTDKIETIILADWPWTNPSYTINVPGSIEDIIKIELDPNHGTVDLYYTNNTWINGNLSNE
jgi:aminopeptidase N